MKITITRAGGYNPALGPKHPSNQDPKLEAHVVEIDVKHVSIAYGDTSIMSHSEYAWMCSCGGRGEWTDAARSARNGGARHVAIVTNGDR